MKFTPAFTALAGSLLLMSCARTIGSDGAGAASSPDSADATAGSSADTTYYARASMQDKVNPAIMMIWDVGNNAMNESGGIDPALMDDAKWAALIEAANRLEAEGLRMAAATPIIAARLSNRETGEYEISMDTVQSLLDAEPTLFRAMGSAFAQHAVKLRAAAMAKDAQIAGDLVAETDQVCASCHAQFWYGEPE